MYLEYTTGRDYRQRDGMIKKMVCFTLQSVQWTPKANPEFTKSNTEWTQFLENRPRINHKIREGKNLVRIWMKSRVIARLISMSIHYFKK